MASGGRVASRQGRSTACGIVSCGGAALKGGGEAAQLAIMSAQTSEAIRGQRLEGIGGSSGKKFETLDTIDGGDSAGGGGRRLADEAAFGLQHGGGAGGTLPRPDGVRLCAREPPGLSAERIPAQAEIPGQRDDGGGEGKRQQASGQPVQGPAGQEPYQKLRWRHGKALRSSSKWGPSRRRGQSPPQTRAAPCACAAALNAAAMGG